MYIWQANLHNTPTDKKYKTHYEYNKDNIKTGDMRFDFMYYIKQPFQKYEI